MGIVSNLNFGISWSKEDEAHKDFRVTWLCYYEIE